MPLTVQGMSHWTVPGRRRCCGLLGEIIARAGGNTITSYLYSIVLALCTASTDDEEDVRSAVQWASQNLGVALEEVRRRLILVTLSEFEVADIFVLHSNIFLLSAICGD